MFKFSVSKDMKKKDMIREMAVGKVATRLCLTLIVKEFKIIVEQSRVVTILNILFSVVENYAQKTTAGIGCGYFDQPDLQSLNTLVHL
jgi:hypothetical protein